MAKTLDQLTREALDGGNPAATVIDYGGEPFTRGWLRDTADRVIGLHLNSINGSPPPEGEQVELTA